MKVLKFKTNLKCGGCVAKVKTQLDEVKEIKSWSVDLSSPDRILTVDTESDSAYVVTKILQDAGYNAELIK